MKSSMHNYTTKIRNQEKRWVHMQDSGDELAIKRTTKQSHIHIDSYFKTSEKLQTKNLQLITQTRNLWRRNISHSK